MRLVIVALLVLAACRDRATAPADRAGVRSSGNSGDASIAGDVAGYAVPRLPRSEDGTSALATLDASIGAASGDLFARAALLLERADIRGRLEDYQAALSDTATLIADHRSDRRAWLLRIETLMRTHQFSSARAALQSSKTLLSSDEIAEQQLAIDQATRALGNTIDARARLAKLAPNAHVLTLYAATLAEAGRLDEATALIPAAASALRSNTPQYLAWLLFQWGLIHESAGRKATARAFFNEAHARLPGHLEVVLHLAAAFADTGDESAARLLVGRALADNLHPALRAAALSYRGAPKAAEVGQIAAEWERYVEALPLAFADHAARFYLRFGSNPARALELARMNVENRPTLQAHQLVVDAALAARSPEVACTYAAPLGEGTQGHRFLAWSALSACGRTVEADALARQLGIAR